MSPVSPWVWLRNGTDSTDSALRPDKLIPPEICNDGFGFGHALRGNESFEVVQFVFHFYGFETYSALVNPNNPLARAVLTAMVENGDYFFFALEFERR